MTILRKVRLRDIKYHAPNHTQPLTGATRNGRSSGVCDFKASNTWYYSPNVIIYTE